MKRFILLFVALIGISGCAMVDDFMDLNMTYSEFNSAGAVYPAYQGEVKVLDKEPVNCVKIGTIKTTREADSWDELIEEMKYVASKKGADAIVIKDKKEVKREEGSSEKVGNASMSSYHMYYEKMMIGVAIRTKP